MRKINLLSLFGLLMTMLLASSGQAEIDDSARIFFPKSLSYLQVAQAELPVFWWNFIVINPKDQAASFEKAALVCSELKKNSGQEIKYIVCGDEISSFYPALVEWANDIVYREKFDDTAAGASNYQKKFSSALSEISFLGTANKTIFSLKQSDPFDTWEDYILKSKVFADAFTKEKGFLFDSKSKRIIIPVQFARPPKMNNVEQTMTTLSQFTGTHLVGAHGSAYLNEKQVHIDLDLVSKVGAAVFIVFILYLLTVGRLAALLLIPPVAIALGLATLVTQFIYGSIHGLTLAFGSGIVGLTVDYGLHGAFNSESKQTWQSNTIGLFTTLVGLGVLAFSGIPLIQQMMVFGILGLVFGFALYYLLCRYFPRQFTIPSIKTYFPDFKYSWVVVIALILCGAYSAKTTDLGFDLRRFNYQTPDLKEATDWFYSQGLQKEQFLILHSKAELNESANEQVWAAKNHIHYVGLFNLVPDLTTQKNNFESWSSTGCKNLTQSTNPTEKKIFAPFFTNICNEHARPETLNFDELKKKSYLTHLMGNDKFLTLFFAENEDQQNKIKAAYPAAHSLVESIMGFSNSLQSDLLWMIPAAILLSFLILYTYYKKIVFASIALIPFATGVGLFFVASAILHTYLDLISVLGLLMVFGFSIDYGVFSTDCQFFAHSPDEKTHVDTALWFAAITNIIGFFPMILVKHPILYQLGFALFYGTIGTYIGTKWGVPFALKLALKNRGQAYVE